MVPDVYGKFPFCSDFLPDDNAFAGHFLRIGTLRPQAEDADLLRRGRSQALKVDGFYDGIADLIRQSFPHPRYCRSATHHR